jgi:hypothetical protein
MQNNKHPVVAIGATEHEAVKTRSKAHVEELAELMSNLFKGRRSQIAFQSDDNEYAPVSRDFNDVLREHLSFAKTIGIYPIDEKYEVHLMAFDIDNHTDSYGPSDEYELIQSKLLPLMHYYNKQGVEDEQMLVENTGAGFHLFMRTEQGVSMSDAVKFLKLGADECGIQEIFPANVRPEKTGNLIRLPLGAHRARLHSNPGRACSMLCKVEKGMIVSLASHNETVTRLKTWRPVSFQVMQDIIEPEKKSYVVHTVPVLNNVILDTIRQHEPRACISTLLTKPTRAGARGRTAFDLALYLRWVLLLDKTEVTTLLNAWRRTLTVPVYSARELQKNIEGACEEKYRNWPRCMVNKTMLRVCNDCGLNMTCEYSVQKMPLPINNKRLFSALANSKRAEDAILLSLHKIFYNKAEHPLRSDGWFRTDKYEIVRNSAKTTGKKACAISAHSVNRNKLGILVARCDIAFESKPGSKYYWVKLLNCDCFRNISK